MGGVTDDRAPCHGLIVLRIRLRRTAAVAAGDLGRDRKVGLRHLPSPAAALNAAGGQIERGPEQRRTADIGRRGARNEGLVSANGASCGPGIFNVWGWSCCSHTLRWLIGVAEHGGGGPDSRHHDTTGRGGGQHVAARPRSIRRAHPIPRIGWWPLQVRRYPGGRAVEAARSPSGQGDLVRRPGRCACLGHGASPKQVLDWGCPSVGRYDGHDDAADRGGSRAAPARCRRSASTSSRRTSQSVCQAATTRRAGSRPL